MRIKLRENPELWLDLEQFYDREGVDIERNVWHADGRIYATNRHILISAPGSLLTDMARPLSECHIDLQREVKNWQQQHVHGLKVRAADIVLPEKILCKACNGEKVIPCSICKGEGHHDCPHCGQDCECESCEGVGYDDCHKCRGTGEEEQVVKILNSTFLRRYIALLAGLEASLSVDHYPENVALFSLPFGVTGDFYGALMPARCQ